MNLRQRVALGRKVARTDPKDRAFRPLVVDFAAALAAADGRRPAPVSADPWSAAEAEEIRNLVRIETTYAGEEPVRYQAPTTGNVVDVLRARLDVRARTSFDVFVELIGRHVERGSLVWMRQAEMHKKWTQLRNENSRVLMICSVDSAKTTQNSVLYPVWRLGNNPNLRIALIGNTQARGVDLLRACADLIVSNDVRRIFPWLAPNPAGPWSTTQVQVARSAIGTKEPSISAFGVKGAVQGNRFDMIIADDLVDRENSATQALIEDLIGWWTSTVETRLVEDGQIVYTATPWKPSDLTAKLEKSGLYVVAKFPLLDSAGNVSWPEHWTPKRIAEKRIALGELDFARFCLCVPRTDEGSAFKEKDVTLAIEAGADYRTLISLDDFPDGRKPDGSEIYTACDPASGSSKRRRDNTAIATIMVEPGNRHTLLYLWSGRAGLSDARKIMAAQNERWQPKSIAIESGGMQRTWCEELRKDGLPVVEHITSAANKFDGAVGIESMAPLFANRQFVFPRCAIDSQAGRALISGLLFYAGREGHTADELMSLWIAYFAAKSDRRAKRMVPTATLRIVGERSPIEAPRERSFAERMNAANARRATVEEPDADQLENDARDAERNRRHESGNVAFVGFRTLG